ncbi:HepT-like ribonuclease domain-containing protein [Chloracidobacterium thermophilum]|jgi:uncharacterized protein with HEPN domain|uniref:Uncharacterized conserved protein n=1 Tax=Chloracidobacterium thermophilum (strain B) TaxID=981222 RepID=G2LHM4_CHLTF|nr:DUF86 domain-containing protein [Chloracidobacterium thermophilum]AEP12688.1 Uncharacterized conserved protein [Chloracidobacterium thermophilum B]QUV78426.1 DUF86 domain-containing protein [Chloracidobacterium thermophilum]
MRDPTLYLKDILEAMEAIERFTEGIDVETFCRDDMRSSAVIRKFEIIGEAAKHIPDPIKHQYPDIPWKAMAGFRDRLIHFYFGIKNDLLWETIQRELPRLKPKLKQILEQLQGL